MDRRKEIEALEQIVFNKLYEKMQIKEFCGSYSYYGESATERKQKLSEMIDLIEQLSSYERESEALD